MKLLAALLLLTLAGCGTIADLCGDKYSKAWFGDRAPHVFGGVRLDLGIGLSDDCHLPFGVLQLLDLPFSLALDILLLPVSVTVALWPDAPGDPGLSEDLSPKK